jgi:hypothetical protein
MKYVRVDESIDEEEWSFEQGSGPQQRWRHASVIGRYDAAVVKVEEWQGASWEAI